MAAGENQRGRQKKRDAGKRSKTATNPRPPLHALLSVLAGLGRHGERPWTGVDGHSTIGRVGAFFGTCRSTKQARSPSDSGPAPVSGMIANNDNNILTNDRSCGTVDQSIRTTAGVVSK